MARPVKVISPGEQGNVKVYRGHEYLFSGMKRHIPQCRLMVQTKAGELPLR